SISIVTIYLYVSATSFIHDVLTHRGVEEEKQTFRRIISLFFGGNLQWVKILSSIMFSMLPLSIYPAIAFIDKIMGWGQFTSRGIVPSTLAANVTLVIAQLGAFILLTTSLAYIRRLRWHVAALISFSVIYLSIIIQYIVVMGL
ncbi:MAG: hypothetical protein QXQ43_06130, partial [Nitrososphaerota archaeon]